MRRSLRTLWFVGFFLAFAAQPSLAATALVWSSGNGDGSTQGVANYIQALGCFTAVDAINADLVPLATLANYDAVLYFSNHTETQSPLLIGNVLADYADTGRRLVLATFGWANQGANTLGGRIITDGISPLLAGPLASLYTSVTMASNDGSPYFIGVNTLSGVYHDDVTLTPGAVQRATWSDGEPLLATKLNVVAVDLFPDDFHGQLGGDYKQLFVNAMCVNLGPVAAHQPTWGSLKMTYR